MLYLTLKKYGKIINTDMDKEGQADATVVCHYRLTSLSLIKIP
jgi:hypothetical protein